MSPISQTSLSIRLTEPLVFTTVERRDRNRAQSLEALAPVLVRGLLVLSLTKASKITSIDVLFEGKSVTDWPEGIGARRLEVSEERTLMTVKHTFFDAASSSTQIPGRRSASVGPGVALDVEDVHTPSSRRSSTEFQPTPRSLSVMPTAPQNHGPHIPVAPSPPYTPTAPHTHFPPSPPRQPSRELTALESSRNQLRQELADKYGSVPPSPMAGAQELTESSLYMDLLHHSERVRSAVRPELSTAGPSSSAVSTLSSTSSTNSGRRASRTNRRDSFDEMEEHEAVPDSLALRPQSTRGSSKIVSAPLPGDGAHEQRISQRSPAPAHSPRSPSPEQSRDRSRGRPSSRFSFTAVSNVLREVSQDVIDGVRRRSASRVSGSASRPPEPRPRGRGGAGSVSRDHIRKPSEWDHGDGEAVRGRNEDVMPLENLTERSRERSSSKARGHDSGWQEFKKGTYTYPISIAIPADSPPSLSCDFGSVSYRLKATVHRAGAFASKLTAITPVTVVSCLGEDVERESVNVERQWEEQLRYLVNVEGKAFRIGGAIPFSLTLMPLDKVPIYRVMAALEEKIDYYAYGRKVARHDPVRRFELLSVKHLDKAQPLLPIISDSPSAASSSPLVPYVSPEDETNFVLPTASTSTLAAQPSDVASHLLSPSGPWRFAFNVPLPDCHSSLHITNKRSTASVLVTHTLKLIIRTARAGGPIQEEGEVKKRMFDIIVEIPVHILSCHCKTDYTHLPTYSQLEPLHTRSQMQSACTAHPSEDLSPAPVRRAPYDPPTMMGAISSRPTSAREASDPPTMMQHMSHPAVSPSGSVSRTNSAAAEQFARLVAGQESEAGETPPTYTTATATGRA